MKRALNIAIFLLCIFFGVTSAYNVMSDNVEVERMAKVVACGPEGATCNAQTTRIERSPIAQSFSIVVPKRAVDVRCVRALYFIGDYSCTLR
jgi:hypothetical protein